MFPSLKSSSTAVVIWPVKTSMMTSVLWSVQHFRICLCLITKDLMTHFKNLSNSSVFEKCLRFVLRLKSFGNFNLDRICVALPPEISYRRKKLLSNGMANVPVIERLSALPSIVTKCSPFAVIISLTAGAYFNGVWLIFKSKADGLSNFSTFDTMSWKYRNYISFWAPSGMYLWRCFPPLDKIHSGK